MSSHLVWYAAYGSNLLRARFEVYLTGGQVPQHPTGREQRGASDRSLPLDDRPCHLPHRLFFAGLSKVWGGGGIAFLDPAIQPSDPTTRGRMWLITRGQFADVYRQENGLAADAPVDLMPRTYRGDRRYGHILDLGEGPDADRSPVLTFTCEETTLLGEERGASAAYLAVMTLGLAETWSMSSAEAKAYLAAHQP